MDLTCRQMQTLRNIYQAAGCSCAPIEYSAKQLAPYTSKSGAPAYFNRLEEWGLVERLRSEETGFTFAIALTPAGVETYIRHCVAMWPTPDLVEEVQTRADERKDILPDLLEEVG